MEAAAHTANGARDAPHDDLAREQPHDTGAEQIVLGAMMLAEHAIGQVEPLLKPGDFYTPSHPAIYTAILDLYTAGEPTHPVSVAAHLAHTRQLAQAGGAPYLHTLVEAVPTTANAAYYARLVAAHADDRRLITAGTRIAQLGAQASRDPDHPKSEQATEILYDAVTHRAPATITTLGEGMRQLFDRIETGRQYGLSTGWNDLDDLTYGLKPGQLWIVGGRPSMGKSTAMTDIARTVAIHQHKPVLYFSLEMGADELRERILAAESRVPLNAIKLGGSRVRDDDWTRLARAAADFDDAPFYIDETGGLTVTDVRVRGRQLGAREPLGVIVVDYLQLMSGVPGRRDDSRAQELSQISRGLKLLAKELGCTVVAGSQLNRGPEQRAEKRPNLADLRESGSIEQDADVVILLHRDDYYDKESARAGEADFIVAKNRNGSTDTVTVAAQLHLARFVQLALD